MPICLKIKIISGSILKKALKVKILVELLILKTTTRDQYIVAFSLKTPEKINL
jgi:hypothetical protein